MAKAPDGIEFIRRVATFIRESENTVSKSMQEFSQLLIDELNLSYSQLFALQNGAITPSVANMQQIEAIRRRLDALFSSQEYLDIVREATSAYNEVNSAITQYFALMAPEFAINAEFAQETLNFYRSQTVELLAGEGLTANFKQQLDRLIFDGIQNGEPLRSLEARTREFLQGSKGKLARYAKQVTTDTLNTFSRAYTNGIAEDLGLNHYFYSGTEIKTTRAFCDKRIGNYYTQKEVESWATEKWQGKKKGTDKDTIFVYLGGYNCRHKLVPVTERMYNRNKD